jgi:predicted DNA-binding protein (UPF0251 family)
MRISQQTFSRILKKAHQAMADAVVQGKIIKIQGGSYVIKKPTHQAQINPPKSR